MWPEADAFLRRAELTEWMDEPCSYAEFRACLRDLTQVNRVVFSYRPTLRWLEQFAVRGRGPLHIVDVGSGAGDMLRRIEAWARKRGVAVRLTGIDLNPHAAQAAREFTSSDSRIEWATCGAFEYRPQVAIDLVISSLFTHHLADADIVSFLRWMERTAAQGWFINDLYRARVPYHAFRLLAYGMRWHRFVRHDGPVSILRGFREDDWLHYAQQAGLNADAMQIAGSWPGRLCVARVKA